MGWLSGVQTPNDGDVRAKLGINLIFWATIAIVVIGVVVVVSAGVLSYRDDGKKDALLQTSQLVFSTLVPLLATWVGTVLAFYFTKENLRESANSTISLMNAIQQKLSSSRVSDAMIALDSIVFQRVPAGGIAVVKISDVEAKFGQKTKAGNPISRLLMFAEDDTAVAILHDSTWWKMLNEGLAQVPPVDRVAGTLQNLIGLPSGQPDYASYQDFMTGTLAFVGREQTLADAKSKMESVARCKDVIVTATGKRNEKVMGWVTDTEINARSTA